MATVDVVAAATVLVVGLFVALLVHPTTAPLLRKSMRFVGALFALIAGGLAIAVLFRARKGGAVAPVQPPPPPEPTDAIRGRTAQREARVIVAEAQNDREEVRTRLADAIARRERAEREL